MAENNEPNIPVRTEAQIILDNYVPGSALAEIDAKMAHMDQLFKSMLQSAVKAIRGEMPNPVPSKTSLLPEPTLDAIVDHLKSCKNVLVLTGAGISTSAGIPDFRTPGTGLYDNVQKYLEKFNISTPQQLFSFDIFKRDPEPFYALAKDLKYPGETIKPTLAHYFIKLLNDKGVLLRNYTQNIDMLQAETGIPDDKVFEVHGSFRSGTCMKCKATFTKEEVKSGVFGVTVPTCKALISGTVCNGVMKPDIVFFGEQLSQDYLCKSTVDVEKCDLLVVMGTSLTVGPVNRIPNEIPVSTPRLLINMDKICTDAHESCHTNCPIFWFDHPDNKTDVFMGGDIDQSLQLLAEKLGWQEELLVISRSGGVPAKL